MMNSVYVAMAFGPPSLDGALKLLVFLVMLSVLVVLHEYGHFLLARLNGVRVNDFAVGFGPTLLKWTSKRSGTNYRINAFPIGGYCAMQGEDGKTNEAEQRREYLAQNAKGSDNFQSKSVWARMAIVLAGPAANFIVAIAILFGGALIFGVVDQKHVSTVIGPIDPGLPAAAAGLKTSDRITTIDNVPMTTGDQLVQTIHSAAGRPLHIAYARGTTLHLAVVTPVERSVGGKMVGVIGFRPTPVYQHVGPVRAASVAVGTFGDQFYGTLAALGSLFVHPAVTFDSLQGPIGMARLSAQVEDYGWAPYLELAAALSLSLGIFNLLPIPALDGGRAVFIIAEMVRGRPVDPEKEALVHVAGFALLMAVMLFVAYHDIAKLIAGKGVL